jgi:addiction module RelB/DinJ family antitoxin
VINVANTATVYARIEPKLKEDVDSILNELGVTPSSLIQMLYSQIKLTKRIPFDISIPKKSIFIEDLTKEELNYELLKGISDIENNNVKSSDEVDKILKDKFNI